MLKCRNITLPRNAHIVKAMVFPIVMYGCESWMWRLSAEQLMLSTHGAGEDSWEFLGLHGDQTSQSKSNSTLIIHWKDWCWSWNSSTLASWCEESTHWKRPWCWGKVKAKGEEGNRAWDCLIASQTQWTDSEGQGNLACCCPWGHKESDTTERLRKNKNMWPMCIYLYNKYALCFLFWRKGKIYPFECRVPKKNKEK